MGFTSRMFVDASALTAMLVDESDGQDLLERLQNHTHRFTSPLTVWETVLAVAHVLGIDVKAALWKNFLHSWVSA